MKDLDRFYPDIDDVQEMELNEKSVTTKNLDDLINRVQVRTGLTSVQADAIVRWFFQEIRNRMLRMDEVLLKNLGCFFISSPKTTKNKIRVFPKLRLWKNVIKKLNER